MPAAFRVNRRLVAAIALILALGRLSPASAQTAEDGAPALIERESAPVVVWNPSSSGTDGSGEATHDPRSNGTYVSASTCRSPECNQTVHGMITPASAQPALP